jgi:hypothetical protein
VHRVLEFLNMDEGRGCAWVQWMPKAEEVATSVAKRCLDFVSKVHVDNLWVLAIYCKNLEFRSQCMVTKFS